MKRILFLFAALLLAACMFCGCKNSAKTDKPAPVNYTVTDMTGKTLTFKEPPSRVIAMNPADVTNLISLGSLDLLVGRGEFCTSPSVITSLPKVGTGPNTNPEEIIMLKPDLVIMDTMAQTKAHTEALEKAGIQVLTLKSNELNDIAVAIELIAKCLGKEEEGEQAVSDFWTRLEDLKNRCADAPFAGKTVYYEISPLSMGLWTSGGSTFFNETGKILGLKNIFQEKTGWIQVSQEQVISRDPDIIIAFCEDINEKDKVISEICSRKGWDKISAVKNKAVFCGESEKLSQPSIALAEGAEELAAQLFEASEK